MAFAYETWVLGLRSIRKVIRVPANPISIVLFPLIQLFVFSQLFRDIVQLPGFGGQTSYLAYLAPGQIQFTAFFAVAWSGSSLLADYRNGYLDKLRATPIHRYAILAGELVPLAITVAVMSGVILVLSVLLGASVATGLPGAILVLALAAAFGVAWSGVSFVPALITKNEQATGTLSLLLFPVAFMSTAFVPVALMPDWLKAINAVNPISYTIEAMRALMSSGFDWPVIGAALVAIAAMFVVLQGATLWAFGRLTD
jgi:ABC-2 type transport system permease protein